MEGIHNGSWLRLAPMIGRSGKRMESMAWQVLPRRLVALLSPTLLIHGSQVAVAAVAGAAVHLYLGAVSP